MHCRYTRVLSKCSKKAAEWQLQFTHHVTNTIPNVLQYVPHENGVDVTEISKCSTFTGLSATHCVLTTFIDLNK